MYTLLWLAYAAFAFFAMDIRSKEAAVPFVPVNYIILMKLSCFLLFAGYGISLWFLPAYQTSPFTPSVIIASILTVTGTALVAWAKISLGKSFTWTGFHIEDAPIVHHGPYRWFKHPLYYGVFLFETGAVTIFIQSLVIPSSTPLLLLTLMLPPLFYAIGFNLTMARKETKDLKQRAKNHDSA